ncbi:LOW QUALITY PROTEIN: hypothetical protein PV08_03532 [Exophiala spinifera]|uniref:Uncharacterized protein n=1 Tax=Exophiala spinifera TaxID=91928 RepID=A0A0D2BJZ0_9EURO|nr:LOW QUALITY PROTEIN: uncharacterized protein PV08_03532 [Exophiala spinifera]KIW19238.1 LOW QUALITY PROTEIN: hypothetical protein PV08_03532 [Exophiala spinifera]
MGLRQSSKTTGTRGEYGTNATLISFTREDGGLHEKQIFPGPVVLLFICVRAEAIITRDFSRQETWQLPSASGKEVLLLQFQTYNSPHHFNAIHQPPIRMVGDDNKSHQSRPIHGTSPGGGPSDVLKPKKNKEFAAWAEYMGEEKDEAFITWKKQMQESDPASMKK